MSNFVANFIISGIFGMMIFGRVVSLADAGIMATGVNLIRANE